MGEKGALLKSKTMIVWISQISSLSPPLKLARIKMIALNPIQLWPKST